MSIANNNDGFGVVNVSHIIKKRMLFVKIIWIALSF